ncbi:MAG: DUF3540 domain-containing protein [Desulfobacteraceae bacterium]|nr:DUF3540 domain-containing protein [Desulfobacteraceae bacterium]
MNQPAGKIISIHSEIESVIRTGMVVTIALDEIIIDIAGELIPARKAFSCIVDPQPDDIIMGTQNANNIFYILGIMERPNSQKMSVSFPSDTRIQVPRGNLSINSQNSVTLASKQINCFSKKVIHKSREAIVGYDHMTASGKELSASFTRVSFISNLITTMAKQVIDKFKGYIRSTEDSDMVKAGQVIRQTDGLYAVDSKYTMMTSKKSTRIDGEKILMG